VTVIDSHRIFDKLASAKTPGLETVYETSPDLNKRSSSSAAMSSSSNLQMQPMLSRGRRPSAAVVEADFAALRAGKVKSLNLVLIFFGLTNLMQADTEAK
jgi:hypothetical protein